MLRAYKYRAYINSDTESKTIRWLDACRNLYNACLEQRIDAYRRQRKQVSYLEQQKEVTEIRGEYIEYREVGVEVLRDVLRRIKHSYEAFFRRVKKGDKKPGFPRFKSENRYNSFRLHSQRWKLDGKILIVKGLGRFKLKLSRLVKGKVKAIAINRTTTNKWYVTFFCDEVPEKKLPKSDKVVGIDVGIKSYLTDSEGNKVGNPKFVINALDELRVRQRKLDRAKKKSNRRKITKLQVSKCYEHVSNQRNDFIHKLSTFYVSKYEVIKVENLQILNMLQNHIFARDIRDCAWGTFFRYITYKAEEAGREVIKVPARNTSRRCNVCGAINHDLKLSDRIWICQSCGAVHDRDITAARNVRDSEVRAEPSVANVSGYTKRRPKIVDNTSANASLCTIMTSNL